MAKMGLFLTKLKIINNNKTKQKKQEHRNKGISVNPLHAAKTCRLLL